jgi:hypothetical protein
MNRIGCERNSRGICLEELRKSTGIPLLGEQCPGRDSHRTTPECMIGLVIAWANLLGKARRNKSP